MDWLFAAHKVAPLQFEMGGLWNPVSVRDQMVRGQELARRAIIAGLIDGARPLIVVGAGPVAWPPQSRPMMPASW